MLVEAVFPPGKYLFRDNNKNIKTTSMGISKLHTKVLSGYYSDKAPVSKSFFSIFQTAELGELVYVKI